MARDNLVEGMVSVIVPVYNCEQYINKCLESIKNQSYKNTEIVFIDDGSVDNSGKICERYASRNKRVSVIHKENGGPASARNEGIKNAKGEFIFFLDADDFIEKDTLNLLVEGYKKNKADLVVGDFKKIVDNAVAERTDVLMAGNKLFTKNELADYARLYLKKPNKHLLFAFGWGRLFRNKIIKKNNIYFDTDLHTFEDVAFNFEYLKHAKKLYFLKEALYNHLVHSNYLSATMSIGSEPKKMFGYRKALAKIGEFLESSIPGEEIRKEVGHAYTSLTIIQLVRVCGQINDNNKEKVVQFIKELVNDNELQENIKFYSPSKGESKILPVLMKLKLVSPIIWVCKYKANKRYGKRSVK